MARDVGRQNRAAPAPLPGLGAHRTAGASVNRIVASTGLAVGAVGAACRGGRLEREQGFLDGQAAHVDA